MKILQALESAIFSKNCVCFYPLTQQFLFHKSIPEIHWQYMKWHVYNINHYRIILVKGQAQLKGPS